MDTVGERLFRLTRFTSGRRIRVYGRIRPLAAQRGLTNIVAYIDRAMAHEQHTRELENRWSGRTSRSQYGRHVVALDHQVDRTLTSIRDMIRSSVAGLPEDDALHAVAERLLETIFPLGVAAITSLPYADQAAAVEVIISHLQTSLSAEVAELGLGRRVALLIDLTAKYRAAINAGISQLEFSEVAAARRRGQMYVCEVAALIMAAYHDADDPDHLAGRDALLTPILAEDDEIRAANRARRRASTDDDASDPDDADAVDEAAA